MVRAGISPEVVGEFKSIWLSCRVAFKTGILCAIKTGLILPLKIVVLEDGVVQQDQRVFLRIWSRTKKVDVTIRANTANNGRTGRSINGTT